jgi:hypothetical protein
MKSLNASKSPCSGVGASAGGRGARASLGAIGQGGADRGGNPVYDLSPSTLLNREEGDRLIGSVRALDGGEAAGEVSG